MAVKGFTRVVGSDYVPVFRITLQRREAIAGYLFALPALLFLLGFILYPLAHTFYLSLSKYNFVYSTKATWVGLGNYSEMFKDSNFTTALVNTGNFTLFFLPALIILSLIIASLINARAWFATFNQGLIFLPVVVPLSIAGVMFLWIYNSNFGILNYFLVNVLGQPSWARPWLTESGTALPAIAGVNLWKYAGLGVILFLAGLQAIPRELYEAAYIDGAGSLQCFLYITLPNLKESFVLVTIWGLIESWKVFALPFVMTKGGPGDATLVLYLYIYQTAFRYFELGRAAAMAFFLAFIILTLSWITTRFARTET